MPNVVLDTNVFVSAHLTTGPPSQLLELWLGNHFDLVVSREILVEVFRVLAHLGIGETSIERLAELLEKGATVVKPTKRIQICRDPDDNKFLECAVSSQADYLVTGDKDLLSLKEYQQTKIITPTQLLNILEQK